MIFFKAPTQECDQLGKGNLFTWTSVKDFAPKTGRAVLVQLTCGKLTIARYNKENKLWYVDDATLLKDVQRWADMLYFQTMPYDCEPIATKDLIFKKEGLDMSKDKLLTMVKQLDEVCFRIRPRCVEEANTIIEAIKAKFELIKYLASMEVISPKEKFEAMCECEKTK
jgi:hypothetical protein